MTTKATWSSGFVSDFPLTSSLGPFILQKASWADRFKHAPDQRIGCSTDPCVIKASCQVELQGIPKRSDSKDDVGFVSLLHVAMFSHVSSPIRPIHASWSVSVSVRPMGFTSHTSAMAGVGETKVLLVLNRRAGGGDTSA